MEYGYWTPTLRLGLTKFPAGSYWARSGYYTRQDGLVHAWAEVGISSVPAGMSGWLNLTGLPYPVGAMGGGNYPVVISGHNLVLTNGVLVSYYGANTTLVISQILTPGNPTGLVNVSEANFAGYTNLRWQFEYQTDAINAEYEIKGDSMAAGANVNGLNPHAWDGLSPHTIDNLGVSGAQIDALALYPDLRTFNKVLLWCGFNNLKDLSQSVPSILATYASVLADLSGTVYCVAVPPMNHAMALVNFPGCDYGGLSNPNRINVLNAGIASLVPSGRFIDAYAHFVDGNGECQTQYTVDGVHPSQAGYNWVSAQILGG